MPRHLKFSILALMAAVIAFPAFARPATEWVLLGEKRVGLLDQGDILQVGQGEGPFLQLRIKVSGNDVAIESIRVRFLNGEEQLIRVDQIVREGQVSRDIDLLGARRGIRDIIIRYDGRQIFGGTPRVAIFGEKVVGPDTAGPAGGPGRLDVIDRQTVENISDRIEFRVGPQDGRLTKIAIRAVGGALTFRNILVTFGNGESQSIDVIERLEPGQESALFDLEGDRRLVERVSIQKRPSWRPGATRVELIAERRPAPPPAVGRPDIVDTQVVDNAAYSVTFRVGPRDGRLAKIAIRAVDGLLTYRNVLVTFGNGETQAFDLIQRLEPGQESIIMDLAGDARIVQQVTFQKRPSWRPGTTRVELLGWRRPVPPPGADGFDIIDRQIVDQRSDRVVLRVPRGEGPFTKIRFHAIDDAITFRHIQILFTNGETQDIDVFERLEPGEVSPDVIVVNGERRNIAQVIVTKRPSWRLTQSKLELLGYEPPRRPPPRPAGPPSHGFPKGWVLIGSKPLPRGAAGGTVFPVTPGRDTSTWGNLRAPPPPPAPPGTRLISADVPVGRDVGIFSRIGLRLVGTPIALKGITIIFGNGDRQRLAIDALLSDNSRTQPIELKGDRFIRSVTVDYQAPGPGRSYIEVYGDYADSWLGERGRRRDFNQGWVLLGAQRALMFSNDLDAFHVGERYGAFKALRVSVRDHQVRFYGLRIVYGNGEVEDVPFFGEFSGGQSSARLDLKGNRRHIDRIELKYRTKLNFLGEGTVEIWGLQ